MLLFHVLFLGVGFLLGKTGNTSTGPTHDHSIMPGMSSVNRDVLGASVVAGGYTVTLSRNSDVLVFHFSPALADTSNIDCFLIHQESFNYVQGFVKVDGPSEASSVSCSPADTKQPAHGAYETYLRYSGTAGPTTARFTTTLE